MSNIEFAKIFIMTLSAASATVVAIQCYAYTRWYKITKPSAQHVYSGFKDNAGGTMYEGVHRSSHA
ncbi:hypothetical protein Gbem_2967 [Citrifermentans bemidjiense Bem]|uniref:Uncharacterized protein n=1 Tax=Citrifermentans bemidjiense (strain ATCC BAA-1014 / DSM 16622 / JCM 12645 / Bem) TaxID=404380 RepID=B5EJ15_CITBB|nr:hypothetical protein Gbem_2967 [Citrifermentans bemidjiense Bem]